MPKSVKFKFPKIEAGFYSVTKDGELVGYIKKEVDGKETNWWVYDESTPNLSQVDLNSGSAVDTPDDLLREAKLTAQAYFTSKVNSEVKQETVETKNYEEDFFDAVNSFEEFEGSFDAGEFSKETEPVLA